MRWWYHKKKCHQSILSTGNSIWIKRWINLLLTPSVISISNWESRGLRAYSVTLTWGRNLVLSPSTHWDPSAPVPRGHCTLSVCLVDEGLNTAQSPRDKCRNTHLQFTTNRCETSLSNSLLISALKQNLCTSNWSVVEAPTFRLLMALFMTLLHVCSICWYLFPSTGSCWLMSSELKMGSK